MYFFIKTNNPRPSFHLDMTTDERATMQKHVEYWAKEAERGVAIVFGPIMDPAGVYGIGVYRVQDEPEMHRLIDEDPANGLLKYQVLPMPQAVVGRLVKAS